jgi:hypothetical protein
MKTCAVLAQKQVKRYRLFDWLSVVYVEFDFWAGSSACSPAPCFIAVSRRTVLSTFPVAFFGSAAIIQILRGTL